MFKVGFVVNSRIKNKFELMNQLNSAQQRFLKIHFTIEETSDSENAIVLAKKLAVEGHSHIIAVGGDGTLHEVVNGVLNQEKEVIIGLLPMGTANDFAKTIAVPASPIDLLANLSNNSFHLLDVGKIDYQSKNKESDTRYFINIAELGMGADVVQRVNNSKKQLGANMTFVTAIVRTLLTNKNKKIKCISSDWQWEKKVNTLVIANARYFGNGMCIAPSADPTDGIFNTITIGNVNVLDYMLQVAKIKKGIELTHPEFYYDQTKKVNVEANEEPVAIEADGEFLGYTPAVIQIADKKVKFFKIEK